MILWFVVAFISLFAASSSARKTTVDRHKFSSVNTSKSLSQGSSLIQKTFHDQPADVQDVKGEQTPSKFLPHGSNSYLFEVPPGEVAWVQRTMSLLVNASTDIYNRISVDVAYTSLFGEIATFPERRPRMFNVLLATVKAMTADLIVQVIELKRMRGSVEIDWWRAAAFALFGLFYEGLVCWFLYVTLFTQIFPSAITFANSPFSMKIIDFAGQRQVVGQVLLDNLVYNAFTFFPVFYVIKEAVTQCQQSSWKNDQTAEPLASRVVRSALGKYRNNFKEDNMVSCALWIPMDFVMFSLPMYLRMPFGHCVGFSWTMILSSMRGAVH